MGRSLTYRIVEDLGIAIVTGQYFERSPFFVEDDLSKYYCVGRAILREVVKILTDKGLLDSMPGHGTWVQAEQNWNMLDADVLRWTLGRARSLPLLIELMQMRLAVEPHAAGLAARSASTSERAAVAGAMERMIVADADDSDDDDMLSSDIAFHVAVMHASGNRFYAQHCRLVEIALRHSFCRAMRFRGGWATSVADCKMVADAILVSDTPAAEAAMRSLIKDSLDVICGLEANFRLPARSGEPIDML
jgi:DNA-binding FadR family transcriptional regulator